MTTWLSELANRRFAFSSLPAVESRRASDWSKSLGLSVRAFLVNDGGELLKFPYARFKRLWDHNPRESLAEYAGRHARFAVGYVETADRKPVRVQHVDYIRIKLNSDGRLDPSELQRALRLAAECMDHSWLGTQTARAGNVLHAKHLFSRRRYKNEFSWNPSDKQRENLERLATP